MSMSGVRTIQFVFTQRCSISVVGDASPEEIAETLWTTPWSQLEDWREGTSREDSDYGDLDYLELIAVDAIAEVSVPTSATGD